MRHCRENYCLDYRIDRIHHRHDVSMKSTLMEKISTPKLDVKFFILTEIYKKVE